MKIFCGKKLVCEAREAKTLSSKAKGWMLHRPKPDEGLLMIYETEDFYGIWMPLMLTDINIAFLDENLKVVDFQHAVPITLDPRTWKVHYPKKPAKYVLELHQSNRLKEEDRLSLGIVVP